MSKSKDSWILAIPFVATFIFITMDVISQNTITENRDATVLIRVNGGLGTGVILKNGDILTAAHVTQSSDKIEVSYIDDRKKKVPATIIHEDAGSDLALIRTDEKRLDLSYVNIKCTFPEIGDKVYTVGHSEENYWSTFYGRVSVVGYDTYSPSARESYNYSINIGNLEGSSGGGVFDETDGRLVGINHSIFAAVPAMPYDFNTGREVYIPYQISYPVSPDKICKFLNKK